MLNVLNDIAPDLAQSSNLEELARPILDVLHSVTGMESAYLTTVDLERDVQRIAFSSNTGQMTIPTGMELPWRDTLCKRALESNRRITHDADTCWNESQSARQFGIRTHLSSPIRTADGKLLGTLCASSASKEAHTNLTVMAAMELFSKLLSLFLEREGMLEQLREQNEQLTQMATHDTLTGLLNRRALLDGLTRELAHGRREDKPVFVAIVDLDNFKTINDRYGHVAGDAFLEQIASRLGAALRSGDLLARFGGDEFVIVSRVGADEKTPLAEQQEALLQRLTTSTVGHYPIDGVVLDYGGASVGVAVIAPGDTSPAQALQMADARMYEVKQRRKGAGR